MVEISGNNNGNVITVSSDTAKYYGDLAKQYRDECKQYAESAAADAESIQNKVNEINTAADTALENISNQQTIGVDAIDAQLDIAIQNIELETSVARDWATKTDGKVVEDDVEVDYSSKYYAQQAASEHTTALSDITSAKTTAQTAIETAKDSAVTEINNTKETVETNITEALLNATNAINDTKSTAITDLTTTAETEYNKIIEQGVDNKANINLDNLDATGEKHFLNKTQATNCLLEIPQNIKYTLADGTLTLKAGTILTVPYGIEDLSDTYPVGATFLNDNFKVKDRQFADDKFTVWVEVQEDIVYNNTSDSDAGTLGTIAVYISNNFMGNALTEISGDSPEATATAQYVYNSATNRLTRSNSDIVVNYDEVWSFPVFKVVHDGTNIAGSIKQVFNGIGFIGSNVWVDKGIKGLIPNGRNADGTLNNIEFTTQKFATGYFNTAYTDIDFFINALGDIGHNFLENSETINATSDYKTYVSSENIIYQTDGTKCNECYIGKGTVTTSGVTAFTPKTTLRVVDANDIEKSISTKVDIEDFEAVSVVTESYVNGTSWYRIWSDGWCEQGGICDNSSKSGNVITLLKPYANTNFIGWASPRGQSSSGSNQFYHIFKIDSTSQITATVWGVDAHAANISWKTEGYIS